MSGAALAFTGALAVACFVKAFGISFLGMPRSHHSRGAKESSPSMIAGMGILALLCLIFGIFPGFTINLFSPAVLSLTGAEYISSSKGIIIYISETAASLSPLAIFVALLGLFIAAVVLVRIVGGKGKITYGDSWDCGIPSLTPRMQYTATAYTKPIRVIFKRIYLPVRDLNIVYVLEPLIVKSISYRSEIAPAFDRYLYKPITDFIHSIAGKVKLLQSGDLHLYLGYMLATLILLLLFCI